MSSGSVSSSILNSPFPEGFGATLPLKISSKGPVNSPPHTSPPSFSIPGLIATGDWPETPSLVEKTSLLREKAFAEHTSIQDTVDIVGHPRQVTVTEVGGVYVSFDNLVLGKGVTRAPTLCASASEKLLAKSSVLIHNPLESINAKREITILNKVHALMEAETDPTYKKHVGIYKIYDSCIIPVEKVVYEYVSTSAESYEAIPVDKKLDISDDGFPIQEQLLFTKYYNGGNLRECMSSLEKLDKFEKFVIIDYLLRGLAFLHEKAQILHSDLKPTNILLKLDESGTVIGAYICDFGFSCDLDVPEDCFYKNGCQFEKVSDDKTIYYIASEFSSKKYEGMPLDSSIFAEDVFAMGMILEELFEGTCYFDVLDIIHCMTESKAANRISAKEAFERLQGLDSTKTMLSFDSNDLVFGQEIDL